MTKNNRLLTDEERAKAIVDSIPEEKRHVQSYNRALAHILDDDYRNVIAQAQDAKTLREVADDMAERFKPYKIEHGVPYIPMSFIENYITKLKMGNFKALKKGEK